MRGGVCDSPSPSSSRFFLPPAAPTQPVPGTNCPQFSMPSRFTSALSALRPLDTPVSEGAMSSEACWAAHAVS